MQSKQNNTKGNQMNIEAAVDKVMRDYIFRDSTGNQKRPKLIEIAKLVTTNVPKGGRILDFGSGFGDVPAVLSLLDYQCVALDDFNDPWHTDENVERIMKFSQKYDVSRVDLNTQDISAAGGGFDMAMIHDVLEHLHDSPRDVLHSLLKQTNEKGLLYATVPNAVNIRKRVSVLFGGTNHPHYDHYYWHPHPYRGHVREYVKGDFRRLAKWLDLDIVELRDINKMLPTLKPPLRQIWRYSSIFFPGCRDTWQFLGQKGSNWNPTLTADLGTVKKRISEITRPAQEMLN
jgi:2-polyprenyl-3-methyl-5-hydroxy-6-metoxy-1,4-benzoquinol methylase